MREGKFRKNCSPSPRLLRELVSTPTVWWSGSDSMFMPSILCKYVNMGTNTTSCCYCFCFLYLFDLFYIDRRSKVEVKTAWLV